MSITTDYIENLVQTEWEKAVKKWNFYGLQPKISLQSIMVKKTRGLGSASNRGEICISSNYLETELYENLLDTVRHEICHLLVGLRAGHGKQWKDACYEIGCEARASGNADLLQDTNFIKNAYKYELYAVNKDGKSIHVGFRNRKDKSYTQAKSGSYEIKGFGQVDMFLYKSI